MSEKTNLIKITPRFLYTVKMAIKQEIIHLYLPFVFLWKKFAKSYEKLWATQNCCLISPSESIWIFIFNDTYFLYLLYFQCKYKNLIKEWKRSGIRVGTSDEINLVHLISIKIVKSSFLHLLYEPIQQIKNCKTTLAVKICIGSSIND